MMLICTTYEEHSGLYRGHSSVCQGHTPIPVCTIPGPFQYHSSTHMQFYFSTIRGPLYNSRTRPLLYCSAIPGPFQYLEIQSTTQDRSGIWVRFQVHSSTWSSVHLEYDSIQVLEVPSRTIPLPAKPSWTGPFQCLAGSYIHSSEY